MPVMEDERFARSVIYICAHSSEGAMGIFASRADAEEFVARDPFVLHGVVGRMEMRDWNDILG